MLDPSTLITFLLALTAFDSLVSARRPLGSSFGGPGNATYDYIVVGGGTAGLAIAARLAQNTSYTVAVIEAGGFYETSNSNLSQIPVFAPAFSGKDRSNLSPLVDWGFFTTPQPGFNGESTLYTRGKCLGGSSARNYLSYQRGTIGAYRRWAEMVNDTSYEWDNFLPYFEKSLNFTPPDNQTRAQNATPSYDASNLGNGQGPLSVTFGRYSQAFSSWAQKALAKFGINPINGLTSGNLLGSSYQLVAIDATVFTRESSETAFLRKIGLDLPNFFVYQSTMATKVLFKGTTADAVEIDMGGLSYVLTANREVILSAGSFQSPQLLMVSGVGPADTLNQYGIPVIADRPGVGQNMWDHILGGPSYRVNVITTSKLTTDPEFLYEQEALFDADFPTGMLTNSGCDMLSWTKLPNSIRQNLSTSAQRALADFPDDWPDIEILPTSAFYGYQQNYLAQGPFDDYNYATLAFALNTPISRGNLTISSASMFDPPVINPNWLSDPIDQEVAVAFYRHVRDIFAAMGPGILIGPEYFPGSALSVNASDSEVLQFIGKSFSTLFHASCTCKMGPVNDRMTVVDSHARVVGVQNLRVVDISAFPLLPPGHPVATIYALAEKIASDILKGQ